MSNTKWQMESARLLENVKTSPVLVPANVNDHFSKVLELDRGSPMPIKGHCARSFSAHKK